MEGGAAHELDVEVPLAEGPLGRLAHGGERLREDVVEALAVGQPLDQLIPEAFAAVRETGRRVLEMRHFDVQLIGGMVLHDGKIAEMATGEGKTLVATLPAYLLSLIHI